MRDNSAASSSRHRPSRESMSKAPFTTSCAKSGNTTKTCRDTLAVAVPGVSPRTSFRWIRSKTRVAVGSARSCRVVVSCPKHETLGCILCIRCRQLSKKQRSRARTRRRQDGTTCIGYRTILFERARANGRSTLSNTLEQRKVLPYRGTTPPTKKDFASYVYALQCMGTANDKRSSRHQEPPNQNRGVRKRRGQQSHGIALLPLYSFMCVLPIRFHTVARWPNDILGAFRESRGHWAELVQHQTRRFRAQGLAE